MPKCPKCQNELNEVEEEMSVKGRYGALEYNRCPICGWNNKAMMLRRAQTNGYYE